MYPFTIRGDKINSQDEFCEYFKKAAHWGPMHRKNESYIDDIFDDIDTWKDKDAYNFLMDEASLVGAKLLINEADRNVIVFIRHFLGNKSNLVYKAACERVINDDDFFSTDNKLDKYAIETLKELAQNCDDKELRNKLKEKLEQKGDLVTLFKSYMDEHDEKMIDLFYPLAEKKLIGDSVIGRFVIILYSNFTNRINEVLHKVQTYDISIKRPFFEQVREYFAIRINGSKTQIYGQQIVDFDRDVQTFKYNPNSASPIKNESYPFVFARDEVTNFNNFLNHFQYVSETLNRDNIENTANYINRICRTNTFVKAELNKVIENIFLNSVSNETIAFATELALLFGNDNAFSSAIKRATKEGTNFFCYSLQYNLFNNLIKLGFRTTDKASLEMLIQFLLFKNEPFHLLNFLIETEDDRFYSVFVMSVKQYGLSSEQAEQVVALIAKKTPDKIIAACELAKKGYPGPVAAFKNAAIKFFPQHTSEIERIFLK